MPHYSAGCVHPLHENKQTEVNTMEWKSKKYETHDEAQAAAAKLDAPIKAVHKDKDCWVLEWSDAKYEPKPPTAKKPTKAKPKKTAKPEKYDQGGMYSE